MDEFKKEQTKGIVSFVLIVLLAMVIMLATPLLSSAAQGYIFMLCHNNGIIRIVSDYVNPITFLQAFLIVFSVQAIVTPYLGSIKYFAQYIEDDLDTDNKWLSRAISSVLVIIFFIIDVVVFQYTYDTILPQVLKFSLPELNDVELFALFYGLNILFRHSAPIYQKKEKK